MTELQASTSRICPSRPAAAGETEQQAALKKSLQDSHLGSSGRRKPSCSDRPPLFSASGTTPRRSCRNSSSSLLPLLPLKRSPQHLSQQLTQQPQQQQHGRELEQRQSEATSESSQLSSQLDTLMQPRPKRRTPPCPANWRWSAPQVTENQRTRQNNQPPHQQMPDTGAGLLCNSRSTSMSLPCRGRSRPARRSRGKLISARQPKAPRAVAEGAEMQRTSQL